MNFVIVESDVRCKPGTQYREMIRTTIDALCGRRHSVGNLNTTSRRYCLSPASPSLRTVWYTTEPDTKYEL